MNKKESKTNKSYAVTVYRQDDSQAQAAARGHALSLNIKKGSGEAGFNAAETLLAALGACLLTNVNAIGTKMQLEIKSARIEFESIRQDDPPILSQIRYRLVLNSPEPREKLEELHALCLKWGTVTNTLIEGLTPQGSLEIES
ncbi:MAG: OsmC family protein [Anaerolineales bacterium]|nr:OsmC family protein [Anaerolineales bacterium]